MLYVFELKSKTFNMLHLFRICRKSFIMTCHITPIFVAAWYRGKLSEKIVQCDISLSNVCNAVEGHCLQAMKIVHHHANGCFDWLTSEHQFLYCLRNTKGLRLSILWYLIPLYCMVVQCMKKVVSYP